MIKKLQLHDLGPVPGLRADFGPRLNLVTGDNGLGKTFLLDVCWYALTNTWANGRMILPSSDPDTSELPEMGFSIASEFDSDRVTHRDASFDFKRFEWKRSLPECADLNSFVIYARVDGGFSIWDPEIHEQEIHDDRLGPRPLHLGSPRPYSYQFSRRELWEGLYVEDSREMRKTICNGLIRDIENWRLKGNGAFSRLQHTLKSLSASEPETLEIGKAVRTEPDSVAEIPTLKLPYGDVPITMAAAGMKRILSLAYLIVWAWEEHQEACRLRRQPPCKRIVLLFDEIESHLHPKWQRVFLPALLKTLESLGDDSREIEVQIIVTTHSPLILGSVESTWQEETDTLFDFDLEGQTVTFQQRPFAKHGNVGHWLSSHAFDLSSAYPLAAEKAMKEADRYMREHPDPRNADSSVVGVLHQELRDALGSDDEYWAFWQAYYDQASGPRMVGGGFE